MKLHVDLETLQLIEGPGFRNPVSTLRFKRGDAARLELMFLEGGNKVVAIGDPQALEIQFGIKPRHRYEVGYLVHSAQWTMPAAGAQTPVYRCAPNFNTLELDSALGLGSATGTELSEITLMGEITWREGDGLATSTRTFWVIVENDVNRGDEGVPQSATPAYPAATSLEMVTRKGQPNGYADLDASGFLPMARLPFQHGIQLTDHGVAIGQNGPTLHGAATLIGALAEGLGVSIGFGASSSDAAVAVGRNAMASSHGIAIGQGARSEGSSCIAIGHGVYTGDGGHGFGRLEIAPIGSTGPRLSGHVWGATNVMQFSVTEGHGLSPMALHGGSTFNHEPGSLPPGMMMFAYSSGNLTIYVNDAGALKTATLPMA